MLNIKFNVFSAYLFECVKVSEGVPSVYAVSGYPLIMRWKIATIIGCPGARSKSCLEIRIRSILEQREEASIASWVGNSSV